WVLLVSPYGKVHYFVGDFDSTTCRFHPHAEGLMDCGPNFYAPNTLQLARGERIVWGWVTGFPGGHGWNGCLSLPRLLSIRHGQLCQEPLPKVTRLRGPMTQSRNVELGSALRTFPLPESGSFEIELEIDVEATAPVTVELKSESSKPVAL